MNASVFAIIDLLAGIGVAGLGLATYYLGENTRSARLFVYLCLVIALWIFFISIGVVCDSYTIAEIETKIRYSLGCLLAAIFLFFSVSYPTEKRPPPMISTLIIAATITIISFILFSDLIIANPVKLNQIESFGWSFGRLWFLFDLFFFLCWSAGIYSLVHNRRSLDNMGRKGALVIIYAFVIGIIPPSVTGVILPRLGIYSYNWISPFSAFIWISIIAYSITKHHLFSIKVIAIELVTFTLWIFILVRTILSETMHDFIIQGSLLAITVVFGLLLIRGVLQEIEQRERIEKLAGDLRKAYGDLERLNDGLERTVAAQTAEVRAAYEVEKKARTELERLNLTKDQFITIAQHHLRTPITAIRWYAESLRDGMFGKLSTESTEAVSKIEEADAQVMRLLNDFFDITQLRLDDSLLDRKPVDMRSIVDESLGELGPEITRRKLTVSIGNPDSSSLTTVSADRRRIKEAVFILLDNAVRYNKDGGRIIITVTRDDTGLSLVVENDGIILSPEDKDKVMAQPFYRALEAQKVNPMGTGVGLVTAKSIVEAHGGTLMIDVDELQKMTRLELRLPLTPPSSPLR